MTRRSRISLPLVALLAVSHAPTDLPAAPDLFPAGDLPAAPDLFPAGDLPAAPDLFPAGDLPAAPDSARAPHFPGTADLTALPSLLITEVMYAPSSGPEWIEILNRGTTDVALDGLLLTDNEGVDLNEGESWFPAGTTLKAGALLVVGAVAGANVDLVWSRGGPALANAGDEIYLAYDPDRNGLFSSSDVIDGLAFKSSWGGTGGMSLSRTCLDCVSNSASSWTSSDAAGGTPGLTNDTLPGSTPTPGPLPGAGKRVLFDIGHCQTCGAADWTPYGGYSEFADALFDLGFDVQYSSTAFSTSLLFNYDVLIVPEPNIPFSSSEQGAMVEFLRAGGGIFMIADHYSSDRNSDGWDSVEIFNGYKSGTRTSSNDWLANNFRFRFKESTFSQAPVTDVRSHPSTAGVDTVGLYAGTTIEVLDSSRVTGVIYLKTTSRGPMMAAVQPSIGGRIVAFGDSSPFSDGTCNCGDDLYDNWYDYDHRTLAESVVIWLAG